jgi:hypothetical protein
MRGEETTKGDKSFFSFLLCEKIVFSFFRKRQHMIFFPSELCCMCNK